MSVVRRQWTVAVFSSNYNPDLGALLKTAVLTCC